MTLATKLRAHVSPQAIAKVSRIFNGSLDDIFNETFQNARRAGATIVNIASEHLEDGCIITISDDGAGIDDPANLVSLGQSDWSDECRVREDPAGMGFFSLAGRDTVVNSSSANASFSLVISGPAWTGEADIDVLPWEGPHGTTISFVFESIRDGKLDMAIQAAARHFPLPVIHNGAAVSQNEFLEGAHAIVERDGYRIGVYKNANIDHLPTINFHGLTLRHRLPSIKEVHLRNWRVKVDIVDAPELTLVLPARKEIYRNAALDTLLSLCEAAIFDAIRAEHFHRLTYEDWCAACRHFPDFPEAVNELSPWVRICADDSCRDAPEYGSIAASAAIYDDSDACDSVTLGRAIRFSHGEASDSEANRILAPQDISFYSPVPQYAGYAWYDSLPCFQRTGEIYLQNDGSEMPNEDSSSTLRPDSIILHLADQHGNQLKIETDFDIQDREDYWSDIDAVQIALTRASALDPGDLTDLLIEAVFSPSDDSDADSYDTQETRFRHDAAVRAHAILEGEDAATLAGIRMAFGDRIAWRIPTGRKLELTWSSTESKLELLSA